MRYLEKHILNLGRGSQHAVALRQNIVETFLKLSKIGLREIF